MQLDFVHLVKEINLLIVGKLVACVFGHIERRHNGIRQLKNSLPFRDYCVFQQCYFLSLILLLIDLVGDGCNVVDELIDRCFKIRLLKFELLEFRVDLFVQGLHSLEMYGCDVDE